MELVIKVEEDLKLKTADIFNVNSYNGDGYYTVNDGVVYSLVSVKDGVVSGLPLDLEIVLQHDKQINNVREQLDANLVEFAEKLDELSGIVDTLKGADGGKSVDVVPQEFVLNLINALKNKPKG